MSSTARVNKLRSLAKLKGWKRRDYYATPNEHTELKTKLINLRSAIAKKEDKT